MSQRVYGNRCSDVWVTVGTGSETECVYPPSDNLPPESSAALLTLPRLQLLFLTFHKQSLVCLIPIVIGCQSLYSCFLKVKFALLVLLATEGREQGREMMFRKSKERMKTHHKRERIHPVPQISDSRLLISTDDGIKHRWE